MLAESREALDAAVRAGLEVAIQEVLQDSGLDLTPLTLWSYEGIFDDDTPGILQQPEGEELNQEQLQDDALMLQSMYQEAISEHPDITGALVAVAAIVWDEQPRHIATLLSTYNGFEGVGLPNGPSVHDACAAMALALQSEFVFPPSLGVHARFSYADAVNLAEKRMELRYRMDHRARDIKLLPLSLLREDFVLRVPIDSDKAEEVVASLLRQLNRCGQRLLRFLFSD